MMKVLKRAGLLVTGLLALTALLIFAFNQTEPVSAAPVQSELGASTAQTTSTVASLAGTSWLLSSWMERCP